jgi:hypothetical protein
MAETLEEFSARVAAAASLATQQATDLAAQQAAEDTQLQAPTPPGTTQTQVEGVDGPTLEEQAAQMQAEQQHAEQGPVPGADMELPAELGDAFKGKTVADLIEMLAHAQNKITEQGQQLAEAGRPTGIVPGANAEGQQADPNLQQQVQQAQATPEEKMAAALAKWANVFNEKGNLTEQEVLACSKETTLPPQVIVGMIQGEAAKAQLAAQQVYAITGGSEQGYQQMLQWMERHVPNEQLVQFNRALDSNDLEQIKFATEAMWGAFQASGGGAPAFFQGDPPKDTVSTPFQSWDEVQMAMNKLTAQGHRQYDIDETYRKEVEQRLAVSNI